MSAKPPVVMVHGMGSNFEHNWLRLGWGEMFAEAGREVVGFDMPGHGRALPLAATGDTGVQRLTAFCEARHEQVDIVGFSAGSVLSLTAVAQRPELFRRAALIGLADRQLQVSREDIRAGAGDLDSPVMRAVSRSAERADNNLTTVLDWAQRSDLPPSFADLARITAPVLLVLGERDFLGDADLLLASLPQARLVTIADTDHFATPKSPIAKHEVLDFLAAD